MSQLQTIEAIEKRLWSAADLLRANSGLASNEYFMPVTCSRTSSYSTMWASAPSGSWRATTSSWA